MASEARNRGTRGSGRSARAAASLPVLAAASAVASGSTAGQLPTALDPEAATIATRVTYRGLLIRGLAPDEAANLTAYLCGIPVATRPWKLKEVNQLLFLRALHESGRFGSDDGAVPTVH